MARTPPGVTATATMEPGRRDRGPQSWSRQITGDEDGADAVELFAA